MKIPPQPPKLTFNIPKIPIPPDFQQKLDYLKVARAQGVKITMADLLLYEKQKSLVIPDTKPILYTRPKNFHTKQHMIVDAICDPQKKLLFIEGAQRTGKSTSVFAGLHELVLSTDKIMKIALLAGKGGQNGKDGGSKRILSDIIRDPLLEHANAVALNLSTQTVGSINWITGSQLIASDLTVAAIKGSDYDIVWVDELDVAISQGEDKRKAVISAVNTMLAVTNFKLILTANLDKGIYQILSNELAKMDSDIMFTCSITRDDCPHLNNKNVSPNYAVARTFSDALMGQGFSKMRLDGEMTSDGDVFDAQAINEAFEMYEPYKLITPDLPQLHYMGLDPSGTGHPFGLFYGAYDKTKDEFVELDSWEFQMGMPTPNGDKWSPDKIDTFIYSKCKELHVKTAVIEGNSGGAQIMLRLKQKGVNCHTQNFGGKTAANSRDCYIRLLRHFLDERKIYLKNPQLKTELTIYNPDKDKEQFKGDVADALLHCLWVAVGGVAYLKKIKELKVCQSV